MCSTTTRDHPGLLLVFDLELIEPGADAPDGAELGSLFTVANGDKEVIDCLDSEFDPSPAKAVPEPIGTSASAPSATSAPAPAPAPVPTKSSSDPVMDLPAFIDPPGFTPIMDFPPEQRRQEAMCRVLSAMLGTGPYAARERDPDDPANSSSGPRLGSFPSQTAL